MQEGVKILGTAVIGMLLGGFYFAGLWYTVRRIPDSSRPLLTAVVSFAVRASSAVLVLFLVMNGKWQRLLAALIGFMIVRGISVRRVRRV